MTANGRFCCTWKKDWNWDHHHHHISQAAWIFWMGCSTNTILRQILSSHSPGPQGLSSLFQGSTIVYDKLYPKYKKISYYPAEPRVRHLFPLVWVPFPPVWAFFPAARSGELLSCVCKLCLRSQPLGCGKKEKRQMIFHCHSSKHSPNTHLDRHGEQEKKKIYATECRFMIMYWKLWAATWLNWKLTVNISH